MNVLSAASSLASRTRKSTSTDSSTTGTSATSTTGTSTGSSTTGTSVDSAFSKDTFLMLLVAQLKNQDPLNPMDSTAFVSQLAQFSSLEAQQNANTKLDSLLTYQSTMQNTLISNLIGKEVSYSGSSVNLATTADISYTPSADATKVTLTISDSSGKVVRTVTLGEQTSGEKTYTWDGKDSSGNKLSDGTYSSSFSAVDSSGSSVSVTTKSKGTVTGISYDGSTTYLVLGSGTKIQFGDITEINAVGTGSATTTSGGV